MKIKEVTLGNISAIYRNLYDDDQVAWAIVKDNRIKGYDMSCKEELGAQAIQDKTNEFIMVCPDRLDSEEILELQGKLNKEHKALGVAGLKIRRVKDKRKWLYIKHSPRWSRNSVAHSYLCTILRKTFAEMTDGDTSQDDEHLRDAYTVVKIIKEKGLRVFGTLQHKEYDVGMVSLAAHLRDGMNESTSPEPQREDYQTSDEYWSAYGDWEDSIGYDDGDGYGDLDRAIPRDNAYKTLVKLFNGEK